MNCTLLSVSSNSFERLVTAEHLQQFACSIESMFYLPQINRCLRADNYKLGIQVRLGRFVKILQFKHVEHHLYQHANHNLCCWQTTIEFLLHFSYGIDRKCVEGWVKLCVNRISCNQIFFPLSQHPSFCAPCQSSPEGP